LSRPAFTPSITAPLPLAGGQPRIEPASLSAWGCAGVELRRDQAAALTGAARQALRQNLAEAGLGTAFISNLGEAEGAPTLQTLSEALELAAFFGAEYVVTGAPTRTSSESQAAEWLQAAAGLAEVAGIRLLVENRPGTWADTGAGFDKFMSRSASPWLQIAFDPAGFVALREHPFLTAFMPGHLKSRLQVLRVRDARFEDSHVVPVNDGNAEIAELVSAALARGFGGFFAVGTAEAGPDDVRRALTEFNELLAALGLDWAGAPGRALEWTTHSEITS